MDSLHPPTAQRGLTLIESAVTLAVTAVLVCSAVPDFAATLERHRLAGAATQLASDVQWLRSEAVLRNETLRLSFFDSAGGSCYVLHSGARNQCQCDGQSASAVCTADAVALKTVALSATARIGVQANVGSMVFDPLHGTATPAGTLRVSAASGRAIHHVVNVLGRVRTCTPATPGPALAGYPLC
jgi:type IV fimbrial biogenesis protein FimT